MHHGVFSWRIMVDIGQAIVISFQEFFIDDYFSDCYSYLAVSNKVYSAIFVCVYQIGGFGSLVVSMLASGTQDRGFAPGQRRRIFQAKNSSACLPSEGK
jgi:hypothetical protein